MITPVFTHPNSPGAKDGLHAYGKTIGQKEGHHRRRPFWGNTRSLLENGGVTPFVSNFMSSYIFGGDPTMLAKSWAADRDEAGLSQGAPLAYPSPLAEDHNSQLHRLAQYYSVHGGTRAAKAYYLDALKGFLLGLLDEEQTDPDLLEEVTGKAATMTFSQMAHALELPRFAGVEDNPLRLLAEFPLPIYITTSHHDFLELALSFKVYWGDLFDCTRDLWRIWQG